MNQEQGAVGRAVGAMIRRSVRRRYRNVYWRTAQPSIPSPAVLYANHHGWMDGYLMFHLALKLDLVCIDWIEEFDTFPLFRFVGGIRYPKGDVAGRVAAVRQTIQELQSGKSLVIFPEGVMHRPPAVLPLGKALTTIARHVPNATLAPVAIFHEMSLHERPEAWLAVGPPHRFESLDACRDRLIDELDRLKNDVHAGVHFDLLAAGTPSVNERMSLKRFRPKG
ncbi:MAG: 1-acyl-sn-glycerol-3-phosphate acyltransferase [Methanoregulaceae archaeon]|nr:1-acyl-sn-glycerol-3-phosphate acyltransferase [Methanoregulaceae archaeon]